MKDIIYRGGLLVFPVPDNWTEDTSGDTAEYYDAMQSVGTTRVHVISAERPQTITMEMLTALMQTLGPRDVPRHTKMLATGYPMASMCYTTFEDGMDLTIHLRIVGQIAGANKIRFANINYTAPTHLVESDLAVAELESLNYLVDNLRFHEG